MLTPNEIDSKLRHLFDNSTFIRLYSIENPPKAFPSHATIPPIPLQATRFNTNQPIRHSEARIRMKMKRLLKINPIYLEHFKKKSYLCSVETADSQLLQQQLSADLQLNKPIYPNIITIDYSQGYANSGYTHACMVMPFQNRIIKLFTLIF